MSWVMAGVAVVGGGIKMYQGHKQKKAGEAAEAEAEANKPEFEIPQEERANMLDAQKRALIGMDPAQRQAAEQDIQRTSQASMRGVSTRKGGLGMISQVAAQEGRSNLALMQADVSARRQNIQDMMKQRSVIAGYKQKRFEHEYNEYSADLDYARAQVGAGMQNTQAGLDSVISGVGAGFAGMQQAKTDVVTGGVQKQTKMGGGFMGKDSPMNSARMSDPRLSSEGTQMSLIQDMTNKQKRNMFDPSGNSKASQFSEYGKKGLVGSYMPGQGVGGQSFGGNSFTASDNPKGVLDFVQFPINGKTY